MKKKLIIISLSVILIALLSINVNSYNDYEGNHNDLECHGKESETTEKINVIKSLYEIFMIILSFIISITLSIIFIYWFYTQR